MGGVCSTSNMAALEPLPVIPSSASMKHPPSRQQSAFFSSNGNKVYPSNVGSRRASSASLGGGNSPRFNSVNGATTTNFNTNPFASNSGMNSSKGGGGGYGTASGRASPRVNSNIVIISPRGRNGSNDSSDSGGSDSSSGTTVPSNADNNNKKPGEAAATATATATTPAGVCPFSGLTVPIVPGSASSSDDHWDVEAAKMFEQLARDLGFKTVTKEFAKQVCDSYRATNNVKTNTIMNDTNSIISAKYNSGGGVTAASAAASAAAAAVVIGSRKIAMDDEESTGTPRSVIDNFGTTIRLPSMANQFGASSSGNNTNSGGGGAVISLLAVKQNGDGDGSDPFTRLTNSASVKFEENVGNNNNNNSSSSNSNIRARSPINASKFEEMLIQADRYNSNDKDMNSPTVEHVSNDFSNLNFSRISVSTNSKKGEEMDGIITGVTSRSSEKSADREGNFDEGVALHVRNLTTAAGVMNVNNNGNNNNNNDNKKGGGDLEISVPPGQTVSITAILTPDNDSENSLNVDEMFSVPPSESASLLHRMGGELVLETLLEILIHKMKQSPEIGPKMNPENSLKHLFTLRSVLMPLLTGVGEIEQPSSPTFFLSTEYLKPMLLLVAASSQESGVEDAVVQDLLLAVRHVYDHAAPWPKR